MGSGTQIKSAIIKYGKINFSKDIIGLFDIIELASLFEASIVTKQFCLRSDTYNMHEGGYGGFSHVNDNKSKRTEVSKLISEYNKKNNINRFKQSTPDGKSRIILQAKLNSLSAQKLANSDSSIKKKKETWAKTLRGKEDKNSQYGTCWVVHKELGCKKIKIDILHEYIENGYRRGRVIN